MSKYISLLRGINVSGHKKIKMTDLKSLYETLGCENVQTYIQSGNVVFEHASLNLKSIQEAIEKTIEAKYGFSVYVDVRNKDDFFAILAALPFQNITLEKDGSQILITLLADNPNKEQIDLLNDLKHPTEKIIFGNRAFYLHCPNGYGKTKLSNAFIENKLQMRATTRNLRTVSKLCEMLID